MPAGGANVAHELAQQHRLLHASRRRHTPRSCTWCAPAHPHNLPGVFALPLLPSRILAQAWSQSTHPSTATRTVRSVAATKAPGKSASQRRWLSATLELSPTVDTSCLPTFGFATDCPKRLVQAKCTRCHALRWIMNLSRRKMTFGLHHGSTRTKTTPGPNSNSPATFRRTPERVPMAHMNWQRVLPAAPAA